jgi:hypothetical protein
LDIFESIIEFYINYEFVYKFDVWNGFLGLNSNMFETFRKNYVSRKGYLLGNKKILRLKDLDRMKSENKLSKLFDQEIIKEVENRIVDEERNKTGNNNY